MTMPAELLGCPLTLSGWHVPDGRGGCACGWRAPDDVQSVLHELELRLAASELRDRYRAGVA